MLRVTYFLYCKDAVMPPNEKEPHLIGPVHMLNPKFIPSEFSFTIAFGIMDFDYMKENTLSIAFKSPNGEELFQSGAIIVESPPEIKLPPEFVGIQVNLGLKNIPIKEEGIHITEINWNGNIIYENEIPVIKAQEEK